MRQQKAGWWDVEVDWLVNCAAGEMGLKANPLEPGCGGPPDTLDDMHVNASARARRIEAALASLTPDERRLLLAAHEYVGPGRQLYIQNAHSRLCERVSDLMTAAASFRRAWRALAGRCVGVRHAA